jgi:hypothetical protein
VGLLVVQPIYTDEHAIKLLLAAIIRRSAFDIALYKGAKKLHKRRLWEESYRWMFSDRDDYFTSFVSLCTVLDQDPETIRRKTLKLRREDVRKYDMVDTHGWV